MGKKEGNKIILLLDLKNIVIGISASPSPEKLPLTSIFDRLQRQITDEVGEIASVFVFTPDHLTSLEAEALYQEGFLMVTAILCPRVKIKEKLEGEPVKKRDTTDEILVEFIVEMTSLMPSITHICLGSGDKDFVRAVRKAVRKRTKIMLAVGNLTSLSPELAELANVNPLTGRKMIYNLS